MQPHHKLWKIFIGKIQSLLQIIKEQTVQLYLPEDTSAMSVV